jgi:hypothetical protein
MPKVIFSHPNIKNDLVVLTGANDIKWGYGLNTKAYPTYGGEVVQILSAYIDDLQITGDVRTYTQTERIYRWFLKYIQIATQVGDDEKRFIETPVTFRYPTRDWSLKIRPMELPGFRLGTDVVAPQWQMTASVVESDRSMEELTMETAEANGFDFSAIHAGIGWQEDNPFTSPDGVRLDEKGKPVKPNKDKDGVTTPGYNLDREVETIADFYQNLIPSYLEGDYSSLWENNLPNKQTEQGGSGPTPPPRRQQKRQAATNKLQGSGDPHGLLPGGG